MSFRHVAIVFAILTLCLFTVQESAVYSRIILFSTFAIDLILGFLFRVLYKNSRLSKKKHERTLLIVTVSDKIIENDEVIKDNKTGSSETNKIDIKENLLLDLKHHQMSRTDRQKKHR